MNPSASSLERAHRCPASFSLPGASETSGAAERGTTAHLFVSRVLGGMRRERALEMVSDDVRAMCAGIDFRKLVGGLTKVRSEVSYAFDVRTRTARELGVELGRRYPDVGPTEIVGTLDIEGVRGDGLPVVADIKTGFGDVTHPSENFQTLFFAVVLSTIHRVDGAESKILRIRPDGSVYPRSHTFDRFDLDEYADTLEEIVRRVGVAKERRARGETPTVHAGAHCLYCPGFSACPAKTSLVRHMLPQLQEIGERIESMSVEDAGRAWAKYKEVKPVFERVEKSLKERAQREELPLANGKIVTTISYEKESFSRARALELLRARGATDEEIASCSGTILVEQVREKNKPGTRAA